MNNKKFISLLCTTAMAASTFASFALTASAEDLFSSDGSSIDGWVGSNITITVENDDDGDYIKLQGSGSGNRTATYSLGNTISGQYVIEYDTLMTRGNGMGRIMHSAQVAFTNDTTLDSRDGAGIFAEVNAQQSTNYQAGSGSSAANAAFKVDLRPYLDNKWLINDDSSSELVAYPEEAVEITDNTWVRVQAAVNENTTTVTVLGADGTKLIDGVEYANKTNEIDKIYVVSNRGDGGSGIIALDNIRIYSGEAEELTTDGLRGTSMEVVVNPEVPSTLPDGVSAMASSDFEDKVNGDRVYVDTVAQSMTSGGYTISTGSTNNSRSETRAEVQSYFYGENAENKTNILTLTEAGYASAARGPLVKLTDPITTESLGAGSVIHEVFALKLNAATETSSPALYLVDTKGDNVDNPDAYSYLGSDGQYKYVLAKITTGAAASDNEISIPADTWVVVDFALSNDGAYTVSIDGEEKMNHVGTVSYSGSSDYKITVSQMPGIVVNVDKSGTNNAIASIDNLAVYSSYDAAPAVSIPESATDSTMINFDALETKTVTVSDSNSGGEVTTETFGSDALSVKVGTRNGGDTTTYASVSAVSDTDKMLVLTSGKNGTGGRAPVVSMTDADINLADLADGTVAVMEFAAKLSNTSADGVAPQLVFLASDSASSTTNKYYQVAATLTGGTEIPVDEWAIVRFEADKTGAFSVYVNGSMVASGTQCGEGDTKAILSKLPLIAIQNASGSDSAYYSMVKIDNIATYSVGTWTKYVATYDDNDVLTKLEVTPYLTSGATMTTEGNTKTMYWNSKMTPYVAE